MRRSDFVRKFVRALQFLPLSPFVIVAVLLVRLTRPLVTFRFTWLPARAMGHAAVDPEMHLSMAALDRKPSRRVVNLYFFEPAAHSNLNWSRIVKRHLPESGFFYWVDRFNCYLPGWQAHHRKSYAESHSTSDPFDLLRRAPQQILLSADENTYGRNFIANFGLPTNARFVCLQIRDNANDAIHAPVGLAVDYNDFRNSPVGIFTQAVEYLANQGYWIVRMGKAVTTPLPIEHPMVIDYASRGVRTELADIWLSFNCSFMLSTGSGIDALAAVARKPIVCVDFLAYMDLTYFFRNSIVIFKRLREKATGRMLGLAECLEIESKSYYKSTEFYNAQGVRWEHNRPDDITAAVAEMDSRLRGCWQDSPEDIVLQRRAGELFANAKQYRDVYKNGFSHRIGTDYLKHNPEWLTS
jgi:putative glycosyltransferase (TIGR04372 family)